MCVCVCVCVCAHGKKTKDQAHHFYDHLCKEVDLIHSISSIFISFSLHMCHPQNHKNWRLRKEQPGVFCVHYMQGPFYQYANLSG